MSLEKAIADNTAAITALTKAIQAGGAPAASAEKTTKATTTRKPRQTKADKEAAAKKETAASGTEQPADLKAFKSGLLGQVKGRDDAVSFTKKFLESHEFERADEVPEDRWVEIIDAFTAHIAESGSGDPADEL